MAEVKTRKKHPYTLRKFLEEKAVKYNKIEFIQDDPVNVPHKFDMIENIEIAGFLAATLAWGQRGVIIRNALDIMARMDHDPHDFLMNMEDSDLQVFNGFRHRTFNEEDCRSFIRSLGRIYREEGGLYDVFLRGYRKNGEIKEAIGDFRRLFTREGFAIRSLKHVADPFEGSSGRRSARSGCIWISGSGRGSVRQIFICPLTYIPGMWPGNWDC